MSAANRPPVVDPLVELADRCVQCGLCLPACPTYGLDRLEAESPRGRIALMRAWALKTIEPTPLGDAHLDHCLGCGNCEAVCPAGVEYGELLRLARDRQRGRRGSPWRQRVAEALATQPGRFAALLRLYRRVFRWLPASWRPLPLPPTPASTVHAPPSAPLQSDAVAMFVGCVATTYEAPARAALIHLCGLLGIDAIATPGQTCCGALHAHGGDLQRAGALAATNREAFAGAAAVLTLASGCHETVASTLGDVAPVHDALAFIDARADGLQFRAHRERVALHLPCTQRTGSRSIPALRRLLARVPDLEVVELNSGYGCCGAAGTQMLTQPTRADDYRQPLLDQLASSSATRVLSANIGCRLHLGNGTDLPLQHPVEFLAALASAAPASTPTT